MEEWEEGRNGMTQNAKSKNHRRKRRTTENQSQGVEVGSNYRTFPAFMIRDPDNFQLDFRITVDQ